MNVTKMMENRRRARVRVCMDYVEEWNESMELLTPKRAKVEEESLSSFGKKKKKSITYDASKEDLEHSFDMASKFLKSLPLMVLSGVCLGVHFSSWVYSIEKTSLVHSLLWVSMGPILLNWGQWILFFVSKGTWVGKPSMFESWGAFIGLIGALVMLLDVKQQQQQIDDGSGSMISEREVENSNNPDPTLEGDVAAFLGAFAVSMYLVIGGNLRSWLSIWLYAFPVIASAVVTTVTLALIDPSHPAHWVGLSSTSVFGFLGTKEFLGMSLYLGAGPGVCGHTLLSALLKYISPLTISTAMLLEPLLGSIMGYFLGMQSLPGTSTWVGGFVLLFGLFLVVLGGEEEEEEEEEEEKKQNETTSRDDLVFGEEDTQLFIPALDQDVIQKEQQSTATANVHHHEQYGTMHSK